LLFISKGGLKGAQIQNILHIWKVYRIFIFHSILMSCFVFEWIVLRVFNSMSTEFSVFYDLQNLKKKMYFHQVLMQFLQVHTLMCYWRSINKSVPRKNHRFATSHGQSLSHKVVSSTHWNANSRSPHPPNL
jgi:hypothetical protein